MRLRKTELAESDLENIYRFGYERFGIDQAEHYADSLLNVFELIVLNLIVARLHTEYQRPVRINPHKAHLVVYEIVDDTVVVVRVLSHRQNLFDIL